MNAKVTFAALVLVAAMVATVCAKVYETELGPVDSDEICRSEPKSNCIACCIRNSFEDGWFSHYSNTCSCTDGFDPAEYVKFQRIIREAAAKKNPTH